MTSQGWGGGGGGFSPPGGGFGAPPPGGGGYGAPPPGGGGTPPPGDGPIGRIPFSPDDENNIRQTALFMRIAGGLALLSSIFGLIGSIGVGLYRGMPIVGSICGGMIGLGVQVAFAAMLFVSANAFAQITASDGNDQHHLAAGLRQLRWYFLVKAILIALGILLCCACVFLMMFMGAAVFAALAGAGSQ